MSDENIDTVVLDRVPPVTDRSDNGISETRTDLRVLQTQNKSKPFDPRDTGWLT